MSIPVTLHTLASGNASVDLLNENFETIESALADALSRTGSTPNYMAATLDMNSKRLINLPSPASNSEPMTLGYYLSVTPAPGESTSNLNASYVKYDPIATGSSLTSLSTLLTDGCLARVFGIVPDGVTNCNTAFDNYAAWCLANDREILLPGGQILITSTRTLTNLLQPSGREGGLRIRGQGMYQTVIVFTGTGYCFDVNGTNDDQGFSDFSIRTSTGGGFDCIEGGNMVWDRFFMDGCGATYYGIKIIDGYQIAIQNSRFWSNGSDYDGGAWYIDGGHTLYAYNCFVSKVTKNGTVIYLANIKNTYIPTITCESASGTYTAQNYIEIAGSPESTYIGTIHGETRCNKLIYLSSAGASRGLVIGSIYAWQKNDDTNSKDFVIIDATNASYKIQVSHIFFKSEATASPTAPGYLILDNYDRVEIADYDFDTNTTASVQYNRALKANPYHKENESSIVFDGPTTTPTTTFDLGRPGVYIVSVAVSDNAQNHCRFGTWRVTFADNSVTDITAVQAIGTTETIGSGVGEITLAVDKDGVVTVTTAASTSRTYQINYGWEKILTLEWT